MPKAATRSPVPGGGARRAGIPRVQARGRRIVHLRTDNQPEDIRTSRRSPMATQHQTDSGSGIPAEDHKQSHSSVRLRCKVDLVSRTSERRFRETNDSLPGSLPRSTSSSHGHAPCLANTSHVCMLIIAYPNRMPFSRRKILERQTGRLIAHETVPETNDGGDTLQKQMHV